jgi:hypothetical protein
MGTASFPVRRSGRERYSGQQEKAPKNSLTNRLLSKIVCLMFKSSIFALWKQIDRKK